jgi:hypothetical protein
MQFDHIAETLRFRRVFQEMTYMVVSTGIKVASHVDKPLQRTANRSLRQPGQVGASFIAQKF